MSTLPNAKRSQVTNTTMTPAQWDSSPTITRSTVKESSFKGLSSSSTYIHRSDLESVIVEDAAEGQHGGGLKGENASETACHNVNRKCAEGNAIARSTLRNCTLSNASIKRCLLEGCVLRDVRTMHRVDAQKSQFRTVESVQRSDVIDSIVQDRSSLWRSKVKQSVVKDASELKRSTLAETTVSKSRVRRATLVECDVTECVISQTDFKGMVLKYGIWKKGELVGRISNHEVVAVKKDAAGLEDHGVTSTVAELDAQHPIPSYNPPAYYRDSDDSWESDDLSDHSEDLPPPYKV